MRIKIIPTKSLGCWAVPLTPASPTIPMAKPAARPLKPTDNPAPSWRKDLSAQIPNHYTTLTYLTREHILLHVCSARYYDIHVYMYVQCMPEGYMYITYAKRVTSLVTAVTKRENRQINKLYNCQLCLTYSDMVATLSLFTAPYSVW